MGTRRAARERALQALYLLDMRGEDEGARNLALFWGHFDADQPIDGFARELVDGVRQHHARIDQLIEDAAEHWRLPRLSRVDLNVIRLATFELLGRPEIPASVTINEAIEIARRYGTQESAAFVNGVLDRIADTLGVKDKRPDRTP